MIVNEKNKKIIIHFGGIKWSPWLPGIFHFDHRSHHGYHDHQNVHPGDNRHAVAYMIVHHGHHGYQNDFTLTIAVTMVTRMISLWRQTVYIGVHDCTPWLPG